MLQTLRDHKSQWRLFHLKFPPFCMHFKNTASFQILEWTSSGNIMKVFWPVNQFTISRLFTMKFFCLVNQFTVSRLFTFLWRYRKTKVSNKKITTKISNIKNRRYNLFIFQKTEKNRILNIHSICNCSDHFFHSVMVAY